MAKKIRPIALGLIEHAGHVFVSKGKDNKTNKTFYRFLGGGIDFGETSSAALQREFMEEIGAELTSVEYLTCLDNIFTLDGKPKHELIQLFRAQFVDSAFYELGQTFELIEGDRTSEAFWIEVAKVRSGQRWLVPENCLAYLS